MKVKIQGHMRKVRILIGRIATYKRIPPLLGKSSTPVRIGYCPRSQPEARLALWIASVLDKLKGT